jgi:hypothetical protein
VSFLLDSPALHTLTDHSHSTIAPGKRLAALQASDFGLFSSTWWPRASLPKLRILTYLGVWLFTWDDEIDLSDGAMWNSFDTAQDYRNQTLAYVRYTLGMDEICPDVTNRIILNFAPIGAALKAAYSMQQRIRMYEAMRFFMEMSEQEQRMRLDGAIPSVEEFWRYRLGCSAVPVCLAVNEYGWGSMELPSEFFADRDVKTLYRCTNTLVSAVNDLLSIKKEIKCDAIDSLIPIIFFHVENIQVAVKEIVAFIAAEIENMNVAAASLVRKYAEADECLQDRVANFIDGCKYYTTGNLTWSLETDRYGVEYIDGEIAITL